jgi:predicted nuclease with TOPRIM domain
MKQTAVEWFEDQVGHNSLMGLKEWDEIFEKAKEMEKEQIVKAYTDSLEFTPENISKGEQYYNENYNL